MLPRKRKGLSSAHSGAWTSHFGWAPEPLAATAAPGAAVAAAGDDGAPRPRPGACGGSGWGWWGWWSSLASPPLPPWPCWPGTMSPPAAHMPQYQNACYSTGVKGQWSVCCNCLFIEGLTAQGHLRALTKRAHYINMKHTNIIRKLVPSVLLS